MKHFSTVKTAALAAALLALAACSDNDGGAPGAYGDGQGYFFPSTSAAEIVLPPAGTSFDIEVCRSVTGREATAEIEAAVTLSSTGEDARGLFSVPGSVTFGRDESSARLTVGYDPGEIGYDEYGFTLSLAGTGQTTPYGYSEYAFTAAAAQPWTSLGTAVYTDDFITTFYGVGNDSYGVEIQENGLTPGLFRLVYPYGGAYPYNESYEDGTADWDLTRTYYLEINACDPGGVYITRQETGMDWGYGNITLWSKAGYYLERGKTLEEVKDMGLCGTYADGVITFPAGALLICMPDYDPDFYDANLGGAFRVVMPGVTPADYSAAVVYSGKYTDASGAGQVIGRVTLGSDVTSARVALVSGKDIPRAVAAIEDGSAGYTEITASGTVKFPCGASGTYSLVAVTYGGGTARESAYATFNYCADAGETWTAAGAGDYEYTIFFGDGDNPQTDSGLVLYQSDSDPARWKIGHWGYDTDFVFTFDRTTGEIVVGDQETGYEYGGYGMVYVDDLTDYTGGADYGRSYYGDGVFHFALVYYCGGGVFDYGYETFSLTSAAAKREEKVRAGETDGKKTAPKAAGMKPRAGIPGLRGFKNPASGK